MNGFHCLWFYQQVSFDKPEVQVQVQVDNWVFIKITISIQPSIHPASQLPLGKFQRSKLELYIQNKCCQFMLGGSETGFRISIDPKMTLWEEKEVQKPLNRDFYKHAIQINICKLKVGIIWQYIMVKVYLSNYQFPMSNSLIFQFSNFFQIF